MADLGEMGYAGDRWRGRPFRGFHGGIAVDRQRVDQQVQKILDAVRQRIVEQVSPSLQSMAAMEQLIYSELNRCKPEILQAWCDQAQDDSARPLCPHCGGPMRHKGSRSRTLLCEAGQIDVPRTRWWCDACQASFFPSGQYDERRGLPGDAAGSPDGRGRGRGAPL